jgi:hypothetical protein
MPRKKLVPASAAAPSPKQPADFGAVINAADIADVNFAPLPRSGRTSQYLTNLLQAIDKGGAVAVPAQRGDYFISQYRKFALKSGIRLLFAQRGDQLLIKPMPASDEEKRLMLMLRSPRSLTEIEQWKATAKPPVEMEVRGTLGRLRDAGLVQMTTDGKWGCTALGQDGVKARKVAA